MKKIIFILITIVLLSCKSTEINGYQISNSLLGVVFDKKSSPIQNAQITFNRLEGEEVAVITTDIDGKFYIPEIEFGEYLVTIKSKNSAPITIEVEHYSIENVLIIRISTFEDLLTDLKEDLKEKDLEGAERNIIALEEINRDDIYFNYLEAIYFINNKSYPKAEALLQSIENSNQPYVFLLLADLYQYNLNNNKKAIKYIKKFLSKEYNDDVILRLKELEDDI